MKQSPRCMSSSFTASDEHASQTKAHSNRAHTSVKRDTLSEYHDSNISWQLTIAYRALAWRQMAGMKSAARAFLYKRVRYGSRQQAAVGKYITRNKTSPTTLPSCLRVSSVLWPNISKTCEGRSDRIESTFSPQEYAEPEYARV